jgi:uncharacterized membrane protein YphA (DoxX/SURF4 family)
VFLRLALGVIFIWAGVTKVASTMPVKGEDAATLANMGVITPPPKTPAAAPGAHKATGSSAAPNPHGELPKPGEPIASTESPSATTPAIVNVARAGGKTYTAEDFPDAVDVKPLYLIAVMLKKDASGMDAEGKPVRAIWPAFLAKDRMPVYWSWAVAATELLGGVFMLLGFLTRFWALGLACVMGAAMWLTVIGPAIASGHTQFGFLPDHPFTDPSPWPDNMSWQAFQLQFAMFMVALAVMGIGPGRMAVDRILFPPPPPPQPKAKGEN